MNARRWGGSGLAVIVLAATYMGQGIGSGVAREDPPARPNANVNVPSGRPAAPVRAFLGAGSCSATACHGSMRPVAPMGFPSRVLRNEHTTWLTQDRHADAYRVLFSRRSEGMEERLSGGTIPAHKDARCLACHATSGTEPHAATAMAEVIRQDGVSCESCHGPAEHWIGEHTQLGWSRLSDSEKEATYGMRTTRALDRRAAVCLECHVGAPGRDVNHDLIAAGHPRLNFEFAAYLANMPPHWVEDTRGNFPARAWAIGQVATARAALGLLNQRARQAGNDNASASIPWPEFSEYNCFSCHHDLIDETWRKDKDRRDPGTPPGTIPWGSWHFAMMLPLAEALPTTETASLKEQLPRLRTEMHRPVPDPQAVAEQAEQIGAGLDRWLRALPDERSFDAGKIEKLIRSFKAPDTVSGWDEAAQLYLALHPLRQSLKDLDPAWDGANTLKVTLDQMFPQLQFPTQANGRSGLRSGYDSPRGFDPNKLP